MSRFSAECDAAIARAEEAEAALAKVNENVGTLIERAGKAESERDTFAREVSDLAAQLAALREAAMDVVRDHYEGDLSGHEARHGRLHRTLADTAAAAEAHDREVRARVWEEADALLDAEGPGRVYHERLLRARATEERGRCEMNRMTNDDKPLISDPKALHEYLVRLAMEAHVAASKTRCCAHIPGHHSAECALPAGHDGDHDDSTYWIEKAFHEHMAQAAQTIVTEVESLEIGDWLEGVGALNDKMRITGLTKERDEAIERAEKTEAERDALAAALAEVREAQTRAEKAESERDFQMLRADTMRQDAAEVSLLTDQRDEEPMPSDAVRRIVAERDALAAQLAALHKVASRAAAWVLGTGADSTHQRLGKALADLRGALYDTGAVAEAHDREVRARALEEEARAAETLRPSTAGDWWAAWLRARAAEIRGGR